MHEEKIVMMMKKTVAGRPSVIPMKKLRPPFNISIPGLPFGVSSPVTIEIVEASPDQKFCCDLSIVLLFKDMCQKLLQDAITPLLLGVTRGGSNATIGSTCSIFLFRVTSLSSL